MDIKIEENNLFKILCDPKRHRASDGFMEIERFYSEPPRKDRFTEIDSTIKQISRKAETNIDIGALYKNKHIKDTLQLCDQLDFYCSMCNDRNYTWKKDLLTIFTGKQNQKPVEVFLTNMDKVLPFGKLL